MTYAAGEILGLLSGEESISRKQSVVSDAAESAGTIGEADQISRHAVFNTVRLIHSG